jgi:radical SAM protein with 4Fe4S-binding SPASM domain
MAYKIADQIPMGTVVQLHWNGEPTLHPELDSIIHKFSEQGCIVCLNTNGLLIGDLWRTISLLHSVTVSIIQDDKVENYIRQERQLKKFFRECPEAIRPVVNLRVLGTLVDPHRFRQFPATHSNVKWVSRVFHAPEMSFEYFKRPTLPEIGICLDLLHHPAIDKDGDVYPCVRNNPDGINWLGRIGDQSLFSILTGDERKKLIEKHCTGKRYQVPLCGDCEFYGVPRGD